MKTRALIIANGAIPSRSLVRQFIRTAHVVICADGGANHARHHRIRPDLILGDLDSITAATRKYFRHIPTLIIADQETTDLEKALAYCIRERYSHVDILGGTGDRIDHSTGSLGCFKKFGHRISIRLIDDIGILLRVNKFVSLNLRKGEQISLIPLNRCSGVTTTNLKYPLKGDSLELGVREGTSNEALARNVSIRVTKGTLLLYTFHPR